MTKTNNNEELSIKILQGLLGELPFLETDMQRQIHIKYLLDDVINNYEVGTKCTSLVQSDLNEKIGIYLMNKKLQNQSNATIQNDMYFFRSFGEYIKKPVAFIDIMDLRRFVAEISKTNKPTINGKIEKIKAFFQFLQDEEYIISNPSKKLRPLKTSKHLRTALSVENIVKLNNSCRTHRERAIFEIFCATGCRVAEVSNMLLSDINWNEKTIIVTGKGDKQRVVMFDERCKFALKLYINNERFVGKSGHLFTSKRYPHNGMGTRSYQRTIDNIALASGLDKKVTNVFPHRLRHSFCQSSIDHNISIVALQSLMGHASIDTTNSYFKISADTLKNEYKKMTY